MMMHINAMCATSEIVAYSNDAKVRSSAAFQSASLIGAVVLSREMKRVERLVTKQFTVAFLFRGNYLWVEPCLLGAVYFIFKGLSITVHL